MERVDGWKENVLAERRVDDRVEKRHVAIGEGEQYASPLVFVNKRR